MKHFDCDWKRIYQLAAGEISDPALEEHLKSCDRCRAEFDRAKAALETLEQVEELNTIELARIAQAAWDKRRMGLERGAEFRLRWALVPLAMIFVAGIAIWIAIPHAPSEAPQQAGVEANILSMADVAAQEMGLKEVVLDLALLKNFEQEIEPEDLGVEAPEIVELPEVISSYLVEILQIENVDLLLKELGTEELNGQTDIGRLV